MNRKEFLKALIVAAVEEEAQSGIPATASVVQGLHESNWGQSKLARDHFNLFGVKASSKSWKGDIVYLPTREYLKGEWVVVKAPWRAYKSIFECLRDRTNFLTVNKRYSKAMDLLKFDNVSWTEFLEKVWEAGWATDPQYLNKMVKLEKQHQIGKLVQVYKESIGVNKEHWAKPFLDYLRGKGIQINNDDLSVPADRGYVLAITALILKFILKEK